MVLRFKTTVTGGRDVPQKLRRLITRLSNRRDPLQRIKVYVVGRWLQNFTGAGSIYGGWAPISANSWLRADGNLEPPLIITGALLGNVMAQSAAGVVTGTDVDWTLVNGPPSYPLSHQFGINPHFAQPSRVIFMLNGEDERRATDTMRTWVDQQVAQSGL